MSVRDRAAAAAGHLSCSKAELSSNVNLPWQQHCRSIKCLQQLQLQQDTCFEHHLSEQQRYAPLLVRSNCSTSTSRSICPSSWLQKHSTVERTLASRHTSSCKCRTRGSGRPCIAGDLHRSTAQQFARVAAHVCMLWGLVCLCLLVCVCCLYIKFGASSPVGYA